MQTRVRSRARSIGPIEIASSAAARIAPRALRPRIDQLRHDLRGLTDALRGRREHAFADPTTPRIVPVALDAIDPVAQLLPRGRLRVGWTSLRTDLSWLARDLRGERRPTLIDRGPSRYRARRGPSASARALRVDAVTRETDEAVSITLSEESGAPIAFEAGQFLTFHLNVEGVLLRRAYSLSSTPLDGRARITVKRMGRGSAWLHGVQPGDRLFALGPSGVFVAPQDPTADLVMIAGGSGITPVIAIAETVLRTRPEARIRLLYGNRAASDIIFAERLERLAAAHPARLSVEHVLHAPEPGWTGARGLLDQRAIEAWLGDVDERAHVYVCGPLPMMDAAHAALTARGVAPERIHEERFHSPSDSRAPAAAHPVMARMIAKGREHRVRIDPGQTLLEAGLAAGVDLPFSCAMGGCGACKVKLVDGDVHTEEPTCLSPRERDENFILTCSSRPTRDVTLEVS